MRALFFRFCNGTSQLAGGCPGVWVLVYGAGLGWVCDVSVVYEGAREGGREGGEWERERVGERASERVG